MVRIHFIIEMIWWTCLASWESEFPFPGSLISTFLMLFLLLLAVVSQRYCQWPFSMPRSIIRKKPVYSVFHQRAESELTVSPPLIVDDLLLSCSYS
jgi:hypothetical protein